jgi:succinate dehydrogenase / fumarate reductase flavoprotein subunit
MGGIPTDLHGRVIRDEHGTVVPGLFSAGESACVSVHGANRLGTNSLVDLVVFGRRSGREMARHAHAGEFKRIPERPEAKAQKEITDLLERPRSEPWAKLRDELQATMMDDCGVFRTAETLIRAQRKIVELKGRYRNLGIQDKGSVFNSSLLEVLEFGCLLDLAEATVASALARTESRGAHFREDFPTRDDANFEKHSLAYSTGDSETRIAYKPVDLIMIEKDGQKVPKYPLEVRKY